MLGIFVALAACTVVQAANLTFLNRVQENRREKNGKPRKIIDRSMQDHYHDADEQPAQDVYTAGVADGDLSVVPAHQHPRIGDQAFLDLTDRQNDEFVYLL